MGRTILNFAYGSNLLPARLHGRAPSAQAVATGAVAGHVLRWHKRGRDGSGKCALAASGASEAGWGVVSALDAGDKRALDRAEGLGAGYREVAVEVRTAQGPLVALAYQAAAGATDPALQPYDWYRALVLAGARHHQLPPGWITALERVAVMRDPDRQRAARFAGLLAGA